MNSLSHLLPASIHWWVLGAVLVFWCVGAYNRLVRQRSAALVAYAALDAALGKQVDYVKSRVAAEGAAPHEGADEHKAPAVAAPGGNSDTLLAAAAQTAAMMAVARQKPLEPAAIEALATAVKVLLVAWESRFPGEAVGFDTDGVLSRPAPLGNGPGAKAAGDAAGTAAPASLAWPEPTAATEITRGQFNLSVLQYNRAISQFPAVLIAWLFRLQRAAPLL